jgi:hypothetical protein
MLLSSIEPEVKIIEKEVFCKSEVEQELSNINIDNLTPIDALNLINKLK